MADIRIIPSAGAINVTGSADFRGAGGSSILFLTGSGQIGAGTTTPDSEFHIVGSGTRFVTLDRSGTRSYDLGINSSGTLLVTDNTVSADRIALSHSGSVGIGTTSPTQLLHLVNASGPVIRLVRSSNRFDIEADTNSAGIVSRDSATANFSITGFGNVGIGSASPAVPLDVVGKIRSVNANDQLTIKRSDNTGTRIGHDASGLYFANDDTSLAALRIYGGTAGAERFVIGSGGAVKLSNYGSGTFTGTAAKTLAVDSSGNVIEINNTALDGSGTANYVTKWSDSDSLTNSVIYDTGTNVGIGTTAPLHKLHVSGSIVSGHPTTLYNSQVSASGYAASFYPNTSYPAQSINMMSFQGNWEDGNAGIDTHFGIGLQYENYLRAGFSYDHRGTERMNIWSSYGPIMMYTPDGVTADTDPYVSTQAPRLTVAIGGNIGIGTTAPGAKLEVQGETDTSIQAIFQATSGGNAKYNGGIQLGNAAASQNSQIYHSSAGDNTLNFVSNYSSGTANKFIFAPGGTETVRFQQSGYVGIGTTAPEAKLDVYNTYSSSNKLFYVRNGAGSVNTQIYDTAVIQQADVTTLRLVERNVAGTDQVMTLSIGDDFGRIATTAQPLQFFVNGSTTGLGYTGLSGTLAMTITTSGNVGIGTASPAGKLDVRAGSGGRVLFGSYDANYYAAFEGGDQLNFYNGAANATAYINYNGPSAVLLSRNLFVEGNSSGGVTGAVRIKADGNVGIGNTDPNQKLVVAGNMAVSASNTEGAIWLGDGQSIGLYRNNTYDLVLSQEASSGNPLYLAGAGNVVVSIDSNNNETDRKFIVGNNAIKASNELFSVNESGNVYISNDLTVTGKITAREFHTTFVSASIIFQSGSTIFGNSSDDTHLFTGSVSISHQLYAGLDNEIRPQVVGYNTATGELTYFNSSSILATAIPGGSDNQVQYNDNGAMAGASNFVWDGTNVGIGTASPSKKLHVTGDAWINRPTNKVDNNGATEFGSRVEFNGPFTAASSSYMVFRYPTYDNFLIGGDYDGNIGGAIPNIQFGRSSGTVYMHIASSDGNVGIGSTTPPYKLYVEGDAGVGANYGFKARYTTSNSFHGSFKWAGLQLGNNGANRIIAGRTSANGYLEFWVSNTNDASDYTVTPDGNKALTLNANATATFTAGVTATSFTGSLQGNITGTAASETLATVTGRGASTSTASTFSGTLTVAGGGNTLTLVKGTGTPAIAFAGTSDQATGLIEGVSGGGIKMYAATGSLSSPTYTDTFNIKNGGDAYFNYNVGIGAASPSAKLEISGFSTGAGLKLNYGNSSGTIEAVNFIANGGANGAIGMQMVSAGVGDLWLGGSGGRTLTLYRDGNVGIGTASPADKLEIYSGTYHKIKTFFEGSYTSGFKFSDYNGGIKYDAGNDRLTLFSNYLGTGGPEITFETSGSERMRITADGNVGIGIDSPASKLTVAGPQDITGDLLVFNIPESNRAANTDNLRIYNDYQAPNYNISSDLGGVLQIGTRGGTPNFWSLNAEGGATFATSAGNVGIGTTSPSNKLQVVGGVTATSFTGSLQGNITGTAASETLDTVTGRGNTTTNDISVGKATVSDIKVESGGGNSIRIGDGFGGGGTATIQNYQQDIYIQYGNGLGTTYVRFGGGGSATSLYDQQNGNYQIGTNGTGSYFGANSGNVGIGTTSPAAKLHVNGDVLFKGRLKGAELGNPDITRNGLTFYVDFNDKACHSGTSATEVPIDLSPTGYTMGLYNGANFEYKDGIGSFYFDGNGDIITIGSFNVASTANTYEVWVYMESTTGRWNTFWDSGTERPLIGAYDGVLHAYPNSTGFTMSAGRWYQVVIAFASDDDYDVYVDGKMIVEAADYSGAQRTGTFTGWLGGDLSTETLQGWIGIARHYNRQVTAQEVLQNYNADVRRFATVSTQLGLIQKFGNVGIGTTAPATKLEVRDTDNQIVASYSATKRLGLTRVDGYSRIDSYTNGVSYDNLSLNPDGGSVGIGTTNPASTLQVNGNFRLYTTNGDSNELRGIFNVGGTADPLSFSMYKADAATVGTYLTADGASYFMGGNLGIGNTNPGMKVEVVGGTVLTGTAFGSMRAVQDQTNYRGVVLGYDTSGQIGIIYPESAGAASNLAFWTYTGAAWSEKMRITGAGNVGIGLTNPSSSLHVAHAATAGNYVAYIQNTSSGNGLKIYNADWDTSDYLLYMSNAGGYSTVVNGNGNIGIGTTTPATKLAIQAAADASLFTIRTSYTGNAAIVDAGQTGADGYLQVKDATGVVYSSLSGYSGTPSYFMANVGIGISSPESTSLLHLKNTGAASKITLETSDSYESFLNFSAASNEYSVGFRKADNTFRIANGDNLTTTVRMSINGNGNVGIGTTNPTARLEVQSTDSYVLQLTNTEANYGANQQKIDFYGNWYSGDPGGMSLHARIAGEHASGDGYHRGNLKFYSVYDGSITDAMTVYYNGYVGIGTATPGAPLDVNGNAYIRTILYTDNVRTYTGDKLTLLNGGNNYVALSGSLNFSTAAAGTTTTARIFFGTVPDPAGSLNTSANNFGNYGADNYGLILQSGYGTADMGGIKITDDGVIIFGASDESIFKVIDEDGNTEHFTIDGVGNVGIGSNAPAYKLDVAGTIRATGDVIAYSDARVKENVLTLENSLELVKKLRGVSYNKIGESEKKVGVIAQEVLEVLPEVVSQDSEGTYSVAYGNITAVLIEAIKQQQLQIDELKLEIKQLKG